MMLKIKCHIIHKRYLAFTMSRNGDEKMNMKKLLPEAPVFDGPYVLYRNDSVFVNYIEGDSLSASLKTD
jgi:hypothetical protein